MHLTGQNNNGPYLASYRNFTADILHEMNYMDSGSILYREVVGLGNKIVIPNLSVDNSYGITAFSKAGFSSLAVVPITTYKVLGIMGAADKKKRRFDNDLTQLLATIANLVGVALSTNSTNHQSVPENNHTAVSREQNARIDKKRSISENRPLKKTNPAKDSQKSLDDKLESFHRHARQMGAFRKQHD
jgi:hypothetical protein